MHARRIACFVLGLWLGAALLMAWMQVENRRFAARLLTDPTVRTGPSSSENAGDSAGIRLSHRVLEQSGRLYQDWGALQLVLGVAFLFFLVFGTRESTLSIVLALLMLAVVVVQRLVLDASGAYVRTSDLLAEGLKCSLGLALVLKLGLRGRATSTHIRNQFDLVDKADHRHVNR
jgi:hypothetical protein